MTNRLLTSQDPEAIQLVNALGLEGHRVHSLKFELVAGNLALLTVESYVEEQGAEAFVEFFQQFNLVPKEPSE